MKRVWFAGLSAGLLLAPGRAPWCAGPLAAQVAASEVQLQPPSVELPGDLARVLRDYEQHWSAGAADALAALFVEEGLIVRGGRWIRGRDAIRQAYGTAGGPLRLRAIEFAAEGSVGFIVGAYGYGEAPPVPDRGLFVLTLRRESTGGWRIVSDMDRPGDPAPGAGQGPDPETAPGDASGADPGTDPGLAERQARVAAAGAGVMPFDLDRTTHVFEPVEDGGVQTVVSDDGDPEQVALIRAHLAEEAERFARGDFHDPAMIHGDDMAGMHALVMGHERMTVTYRDVPEGGEIRYRTADPELVTAIHAWFEAQLRDHGAHAHGPG